LSDLTKEEIQTQNNKFKVQIHENSNLLIEKSSQLELALANIEELKSKFNDTYARNRTVSTKSDGSDEIKTTHNNLLKIHDNLKSKYNQLKQDFESLPSTNNLIVEKLRKSLDEKDIQISELDSEIACKQSELSEIRNKCELLENELEFNTQNSAKCLDVLEFSALKVGPKV